VNLVRIHGTTKWHARIGDTRTACGLQGMAEVRSCRRSECSRAPARPRQQVEDAMMTEQTYNVALLRKVREQILHHPETHEQASWIKTVTLELPETPAGAAQYPTGKRYFRHIQKVACGTTACVAG